MDFSWPPLAISGIRNVCSFPPGTWRAFFTGEFYLPRKEKGRSYTCCFLVPLAQNSYAKVAYFRVAFSATFQSLCLVPPFIFNSLRLRLCCRFTCTPKVFCP